MNEWAVGTHGSALKGQWAAKNKTKNISRGMA